MAGAVPGIILGLLFIVYILIRCLVQPELAPPIPKEERASWALKIASLREVILPVLLIIAVLGSIFFGLATPTEAGAVGALGTVVCAAIYRKLTWENFRSTCWDCARVTAMGLWIFLGSRCFSTIYYSVGAPAMVENALLGLPGGAWTIMIAIQLIWIVLGCLLDPWGIIMITGPVFVPVIQHLGFDTVWFGILFIVNMEMSYLTPPFGMNLFYLKAVVPANVTMGDIIHSIWPFVGCQLLTLVLVMVFPALAMWLPSLMFKPG
jgi:tripartite ATP-independent transporter DctM subunit